MPEPRSVQAFLKLARERFQQAQDATDKQRRRELADLAFYAGGENQWDPETIRNRKAQTATQDGMPPVPARPCLTINKVREPVHQVLNQERQSDMGIELVPADDWGELGPPLSEDEIELREGLVRRIQRESEAADARTWAFMRATIAGVGYYRVLTRYVSGKSWDKEVYVARIYNQASVSLDPAHEQPDGSDAEWAFIGGDVPWDRYKRDHPKAANGEQNRLVHVDETEFRALGEEYPGWFAQEGETRSARVVEYFYTEWDLRTLTRLVDGRVLWQDELPDNVLDDAILDQRDVPQKTIKWAKIDATQILEETDWEGPDMPIIKVLGEELQPYDNERRAEGMVRPARDAQQGFNAMISKWVEMVGYAPIPPFQLEETNIGPYGQWYQLANTRALPFLPYIGHDESGREIGPPTRVSVTTDIAAVAQSTQMFDEAIKSTTMVPSVQLGQHTDAELKSGRAIQALQAQAQLGTSNFLDNMKRAVRYEGKIENNLLYPIYGRPGRLARMLNGEGEPVTAQIGGSNGQPGAGRLGGDRAPVSTRITPSLAGMSAVSPMGAAPSAIPPKPPKVYTLTKDANFNVLVKVTRSFDSRREEEATTIGNLIQSNPMFMAWFGDLFLKNQDGPGHEEMAERAKIMLDPKIQQMLQAQESATNIPPEVQAQVVQLQTRLHQAEQILGQAKQELESKVQITKMELESKERIASLDNQTKLTIAKLGAQVKHLQTEFTDQVRRLQMALDERARVGDQQHEVAMHAVKAHHELKKLRIVKTLQRGPNGQVTGVTEDREDVPE